MSPSQMCTRASLASPESTAWSQRLRPVWDPGDSHSRPVVVHKLFATDLAPDRIELDLTGGATPDDAHVDVPPGADVHPRTRSGASTTTSVAPVVDKPAQRLSGVLRVLGH